MIKMVLKGMKQRRKEIRYVSIVTFVAVFFMAGIMLFQNMMNAYIFDKNLYNYGDWVVSSCGQNLKHPYFLMESSCTTAESLVNENGKSNMILIGKADANFFSTYKELFYEGRMPQAEDEIVMDIVSLSVLGYSYDLEQIVEVYYLKEDGSVVEKEYKLVGVIKNFSEIWKKVDDTQLPNMFICESEFEKNTIASRTTYFYQLNPDYNEIDTAEFALSFIDENVAPNPICYNKYVYENGVWGSEVVFEKVNMAIMLIAALSITYLMISYIGKRRKVYYQFRCIGATRLQVRKIIIVECLHYTLPQAIAGMGFSYFLAWVIGKGLKGQITYNNIYQFNSSGFFKQVAVVCGVIVFSIFITQFTINEKRLAGNVSQIKPTRYKRLRRVSQKTKHPEKTIVKRQNLIRPGQTFISALFSLIVCGCLVFCVYKISNSIQNTIYNISFTSDCEMWFDDVETYDFQMEIEEDDGIIHVYTHNTKPSAAYLGVDEKFLDTLNRVPGVKEIEYYWTDEIHYLKWDGMEYSTVMNEIKKNCHLGTPFEYEEEMVFYNDKQLEELQKHISAKKLPGDIDWEAVKKGEEVIIFYTNSFGIQEENTLMAGNKVYITHCIENYEFPVKVAAIYSTASFEGRDSLSLWTDSYKLIGSKVLAEKIVKSEGKTLKYNTLQITYDNYSSYESTDKQIAALAANNGMRYHSDAEYRRSTIRQMIQDIGIYGSIFVMIFSVYIIQQKRFLISKEKYRKLQYIKLKRIGMEDYQYHRYEFREEVKQYLWIFSGLFLGYILIGYSECVRQLEFVQQNNLVKPGFTELVKVIAIPNIKSAKHIVFIGIIAVVYVVMLIISSRTIKKVIKEDR